MYINVFKKSTAISQRIKTFFSNFALAFVITLVAALMLGYQPILVISNSMNPTILRQSLIVVTPIDYDRIEVGDIVTYSMGTTLNTHRVVAKYDNGSGDLQIITANEPLYIAHVRDNENFPEVVTDLNQLTYLDDNNQEKTLETDGVITQNRVEGVVIFHSYPIGVVFWFLQDTFNLTISVAFVVLAFMIKEYI